MHLDNNSPRRIDVFAFRRVSLWAIWKCLPSGPLTVDHRTCENDLSISEQSMPCSINQLWMTSSIVLQPLQQSLKSILDEGRREYTTVGTTGIACGEDVRPSDRKEGKPQWNTKFQREMVHIARSKQWQLFQIKVIQVGLYTLSIIILPAGDLSAYRLYW